MLNAHTRIGLEPCNSFTAHANYSHHQLNSNQNAEHHQKYLRKLKWHRLLKICMCQHCHDGFGFCVIQKKLQAKMPLEPQGP